MSSSLNQTTGGQHLQNKPRSLAKQEASGDVVGRTSFSVKSAWRAAGAEKSVMSAEKMSSLSRLKAQRVGYSHAFDKSMKPPIVKKVEKNQVVISINCSKAVTVAGYEKICGLMEPVKTKLQ